MLTYNQTIELVQVEIDAAVERIKAALSSERDLAQFSIVGTDSIAVGIVDELSWQYGSKGRY